MRSSSISWVLSHSRQRAATSGPSAPAAEHAFDAVPDRAVPDAAQEASPRLLGGGGARQAAHAILQDVADAALFARIQPEAVLPLAGIDLEVVRTIVEGAHGLGADRAGQLAGALGVLDSGAALLLVGDGRRFQRV